MRRSTALLATALFLLPVLTACEGPSGPEGPAGSDGAAGPAGPVGPAGQDANENCTQCHTDNVELFAKQVQYEESTHRNGGNFERSTAMCAGCHTHQGFIERMEDGVTEPLADVMDPAPINCRTCHKIHESYTSADYALTAAGAVTLKVGDHGTVDFGDAAGNLCAQCHQAPAFSPTAPVIGGDDVTITSSRYGYHHGPQAQIVGGVGVFEFEGSETIGGGPSSHGDATANENLCATCHMGQAYGVQAGGHTWKMSYEYHGSARPNVAGCNTCHEAVEDFDSVQDEVEALLVDLETELVEVGIKAGMSDDYTIHGLSPYAVTGTWPADLAAAFLNWQLLAEDRSLGLHNPAYAKAVLKNTIEFDMPPTVSITAPADGAALIPGSTYEITWAAADVEGPVTVDLFYTDVGGADVTIATDLTDGIYSWDVPSVDLFGSSLKATVTSGTAQTASDMVLFSIAEASARGYVGSATCNNCHETAYTEVFDSGHPYKLNKVEGGVAPTYPFSTVPNTPAGSTWSDVSYVIGGYGWKARFIDLNGYIITAGGLNQYNLATEGWVDYHKDEVAPYGECGLCHTTGFQTLAENGGVNQDGMEGVYGTWEEPGVGCEACHGPGVDHITSQDAADIMVDYGNDNCTSCHNRGALDQIPASGGFVKHHEQGNEWTAGAHGGTDTGCNTCHDAHIGAQYGHAEAGGIIATCESCHADKETTNNHVVDVSCITCHMPFSAKSALATNIYTGDIRSHLFNINSDAELTKDDMFTEDGSLVAGDFVTLDFACYSCHKDADGVGGSASAKTIAELSARATGIHN